MGIHRRERSLFIPRYEKFRKLPCRAYLGIGHFSDHRYPVYCDSQSDLKDPEVMS